MAAEGGRSEPSLIDTLRSAPERFELIEAVKILERAGVMAAKDSGLERSQPVGGDADPRSEAVRLRAATGLDFPASELVGYDGSSERPTLDVSLMGLNGPSGVLPCHYTEMILGEERAKSSSLRDFFDLLNHRAISLFVRAAAKYRIAKAFERSGGEADDPVTNAIFGLIGFGEPSLRGRLAAADMALAYYAGHYAHQPRTGGVLARILSDHFQRAVIVTQFRGSWARLPPHEQTRLSSRHVAGAFAALGVDSLCGSWVFDVQAGFRVTLGPMGYDQFMAFMPGAPLLAELVDLTRTYVGPTYSFDVQLVLRADEIPPLKLSTDPRAGGRLGWNTWLPVRGSREDPDDAAFSEQAGRVRRAAPQAEPDRGTRLTRVEATETS
jgi:type VI secretion system protein ImpH